MKNNHSFGVRDLWVTLGPNGAYWVWSKQYGTSSHDVPPRLSQKVREYASARPKVTLGMGGSFVYWDDDGQWFCSLYEYPGLHEWLEKNVSDNRQIMVCIIPLPKERKKRFHGWFNGI